MLICLICPLVWTFVAAEFECREVGQFPDPNDPQVFYICIDLGNGKLMKQQYRCEKGKIYDRFSRKCVDDGLGTSTVTTSHPTTPPPTTTQTVSTVPTITQTTPALTTSAPTKSTTQTVPTVTQTTIAPTTPIPTPTPTSTPTSTPTPTTSTPTPTSTSTSTSTPTSTSTTQTQTVPTITQTTPAPTKTTTKTGVTIEPDEFHCPKEGYYPNPKDKHEFYQCVNGGDGTYKAYKFRCDPHTEYDPDLHVCKLEVSTKKPQLQILKINSNYAN